MVQNSAELQRLIQAFEQEAGKFHPTTLSIEYVLQDGVAVPQTYAKPNHAVVLWQYYGVLGIDFSADDLAATAISGDHKWGLKGAKISCFGVIEREPLEPFLRMATRAGSLFSPEESHTIKARVLDEIFAAQATGHGQKKVGTTNDNPLAIWLNYILYHLSVTSPGRERVRRIDPDPFALSLLALERLRDTGAAGKIDAATGKLADHRFRVALSFPGEHRSYVSQVAATLKSSLGREAVFYDNDYEAELARPNLDIVLQNIYRRQSDLVVVFVCGQYAEKQWCGLEWRAIRDLLKVRADDKIMFVRFDDANLDGILSIDGYVDARTHTPEHVGELIVSRLAAMAQ